MGTKTYPRVVAGISLVVAAIACSSGQQSGQSGGQLQATSPQPESSALPADTASTPSSTSSEHAHAATFPPVTDPVRNAFRLRVSLEALLGQHAFLTTQAMRARLRGDPDFAQATVTAVSGNTDDLTGIVNGSFGNAAGQQFRELWQRQVLSQIDYARALAQGDKAGQAHASEQLSGSVGSLSVLLQDLTHGAAPASAISSALRAHLRRLLGAADAYQAKDYPRAYALERQDYRQMMGLGRTLAAATVTSRGAKLPADFDSPVSHLQSALGGLLGEHFELTVDAMRAGFSRAPEFPQSAALLNGNTQDLTSAFDVLFGKATADRFMTLWADHVDAMVRYTSGGVSGDKRAQSKAVDALSTFEAAFAAFLSKGTQGRLAAPALAQGLRMHDHQLLDQVDAYGAKDYAKAHAVTFQGYQHMFDTAAGLATAIGPTVAARLPRGGVSTGGGGMAQR